MSRGQTLTMTVRFTTKLLWKHLSTRESCLVNTWIIQGPARVSRGDRCILKVDGHPHHALHDIKEGVEKIEDGSMQTKLSRFLLKYRSTPPHDHRSSSSSVANEKEVADKIRLDITKHSRPNK